MIIRREVIDSETGNTIAGEVQSAVTTQPSPTVVSAIEQRRDATRKRIQEMITLALEGKLPRERELQPWEPQKLSPSHINMVLDKVAGLSHKDIGVKHRYDESRVSVVLRHPDAQLLLSTILSGASDEVVDINERLKHISDEALNVKVDLMRNTSVAAAVRDKIATDLLDRAGYAPKREISVAGSVEHTHVARVPTPALQRLTDVLQEVAVISSTVDYSKHLRRPQDDEVAQAADLQIGAGHTLPVVGPLHNEAPEEPAEERVA